MPDIIPGGIYGGIFTPTQTVAVAVPLCAGGRHGDLQRIQSGQFGCDAAQVGAVERVVAGLARPAVREIEALKSKASLGYTCQSQERVFPRENRRRRMRHPQWWTERSGKRTGNRPAVFDNAGRSLLERDRCQGGTPKEQTCIARRISQVKRTAGAAHGFWPWIHVCPWRMPCPLPRQPPCSTRR